MKLYASSKCTKFQSSIFIFGCAIADKKGNTNGVTIWDALGISVLRQN